MMDSLRNYYHLLIIFIMHTCNARTPSYLNINYLLLYLKGIKDTGKELCENDAKRKKESIRNEKVF